MRLSIVFHFNINQNDITQQFCENKTKPELHCEGKCYLKKRLKQLENEAQIPTIYKFIFDEYLYFHESRILINAKKIINFPSISQKSLTGIQENIFRPPQKFA
jgi:hypothetical protein